jgi:hypothetical protein
VCVWGWAVAQEDELTAEFAWQQKVFSRREVAMYAQADDNAPMLERKYRDQLLADGVAKGHTLFTYVHSDDFNAQHEIHRTVSTSTGERMQHLVRRLLGKTANPTMVCTTLHPPQLPHQLSPLPARNVAGRPPSVYSCSLPPTHP